MVSNINLLNTELGTSLSGLNKCSCESSNTGFDMVMISLLKAVAAKNSQNITVNINVNSDNKENLTSDKKGNSNGTLALDTINSSQNSNKVSPTNKDESINAKIEKAVKASAKKYGVDENLIKAIIKVESNFNPNVESTAGAKGLMQLMPFTYKSYGITNPFDIAQNIDGGTKHIKEYLDMYGGDVQMGLMAYNGGPGRMKNRGVNSINDIYKMPKETQNYVPKVMKYYKG